MKFKFTAWQLIEFELAQSASVSNVTYSGHYFQSGLRIRSDLDTISYAGLQNTAYFTSLKYILDPKIVV